MSMSKDHSTQLWNSVQDNDFATYLKISTILLNPATPLKHIPLRIYLPSSTPKPSSPLPATNTRGETPLYTFRTIQTLIPPHTASREPQTIGSAMNSVLPTLFPSRRDAILAEVILHGATVPFKAVLEELMREASYADGWINVCVVMLN
ncbi:Autophagy 5 protein [Rutstroemia sp. NJR-2017a BBW]|nr:Autophagy 5 protein [Rutstroemia sp. NJR-2017a BBW]